MPDFPRTALPQAGRGSRGTLAFDQNSGKTEGSIIGGNAEMAGNITPAELRERYQAGGEIAIVDAREEGSFHERHL